MVLDKVIDDIVNSAKAEANIKLAETESQRQSILDEAKATVSDIRKREEIELNETVRRLRCQETSSVELEAKKIVLAKKKEILDLAFEATVERLCSMSNEKKREIYRSMVESAQEVMDQLTVYCPQDDAQLLEGIAGITAVEEPDMKGGLVMENMDGTIRIDYGFRTMLDGIWENELKTISEILFG